MYVLIVRVVKNIDNKNLPYNQKWAVGEPSQVYPLAIYFQRDEVERAMDYLRKTQPVAELAVQVGYLVLQNVEIDQLMQDYGALYGMFYPENITGIKEGVKPLHLKDVPDFLGIGHQSRLRGSRKRGGMLRVLNKIMKISS
jgi:hypothetical protein